VKVFFDFAQIYLRISVVYLLVFTQAFAMTSNCFTDLMISYSRPREKGRRFHLGLYRESIERFKSLLQNTDLLGQKVDGPEDMLALYEAYASRLGIESLQDKVLANELTTLQKNRIKVLEKFYKKDKIPIDTFSVRQIVEKMYVLSLAPEANILGRFAERWKYTMSFSAALQQRATMDLVSHGIEEGLIKTANLKSMSTISRFRRWRRKYPNIEQSIISMAFLSFRLFQTLPVLLPAYTIRRAKNIPPEVIDKILKHGFQAARPELEKMYGFSIQFNHAFELASTVYTFGIVAYYGYFFIRDFEGVSFLWSVDRVDKKKLDELQRKTFDAQRIRLEQLENWKNGIKLFENRNPTQAEIEEHWQELLATPDENFLVDYN
jgi:hypothetical protein